jgi:hypothetical protein
MNTFLKTTKALFTLKPHGNDLCGLKAEMWLLLLRSSVLLIAGCEAVAWGFIGYLMAEATHPWIAALLIGGAVGCLIGGLDAAFVMIDFSPIRHAESSILPQGASRFERTLFLVRQKFTKAHLGALVRMVMVAVSLTITAPFLAQLLFSRDIADRQQAINNRAMAKARAEIVRNYQKQKGALQEDQNRLADARSHEIAGRGLSHRYGEGPVAKSLAGQIDSLQKQIGSLEDRQAADLKTFDGADSRTLARKYGLALSSDGIVARFEALRQMEQIPGFRWTENAFRILLAGFFFGLVIFKWYEPRALAVYFDEELQGAFQDFRSGHFDEFLAEIPINRDGRMNPLAFEDWYYSSAKLREKARRLREKLAALTARHKSFESAIDQLSVDPGDEMGALQSKRNQLVNELDRLRTTLEKESEDAERVATEIVRYEEQVANASSRIATVEDDVDEATLVFRIRRIANERLSEARTSKRRQDHVVAEALRRQSSKQEELNKLDAMIERLGSALVEFTKAKLDERLKTVRDISAAQQEGLA